MNFAFVSMEYQELGFPLKNENALVILNEDNQPTHVAHAGEFNQLGTWIPKLSRDRIIQSGSHIDIKFQPDAFAKIIRGFQHSNLHLEYESWQEFRHFGEDVELYNPVSVIPFSNPQKKLVFADITVYAGDMHDLNRGNYASREPVRNKSALVCINTESEIIFVAQARKFREVSPEELVVHKLPQDQDSLRYDRHGHIKNIQFDHLNWSWEKTTNNV